ncbi:AAA family ATPase [Lysobacter capsici]|uniref:AAA family ATPase n=1 Tax=Lysobacter capsici TaxID=435897 RepID=UPI00287BC342|nr:AAA family ATPase [Lysobacter capsici]WND79068.1 AAA family ATPase [Lysobacter capsici]WND84263.1 AAA family ATPase [Lysobacter capsici]
MLSTLAIANYRSLRELVVPMGRLNVVTGANGSGKSNLYRALRLLAQTAQGGVVTALAREGGLESTLWAGPETISARMKRGEVPIQGGPRNAPVSLRLGFAGDEFGYAIDLGLPTPSLSMFAHDPEIKREAIWSGPFLRSSNLLVDRRGPMARVREGRGWRVAAEHLSAFDSVFAQIADPRAAPEVLSLRETIRGWRFYDHFRSDAQAPARQPQLGTRTPVLSHDGRDLAAAWRTIVEIGDPRALAEAVDDAFPGARVEVDGEGGRFALRLFQHGLLRPLSAAELSDGTLRYLLWIAALHTPRPPPLMVLNEPETSLHPDLLPALARLIAHASRRTQVWVVSHASRLISALEAEDDCNSLHLEKQFSQTGIAGQGMLDAPAWYWPER